MAGDKTIHLAILDDYQNFALTFGDWKSITDNFDVKITVFNESIPVEKRAEVLKPFTIIHTTRERTPFPRELLTKLPNLKLLSTNGGRNLSFDIEAIKELGIIATHNRNSDTLAVGGKGTQELTWALIFALTKNTALYDQGVRAGGPWQVLGNEVSSVLPFPLRGSTIGLVGLGRIGGYTANVARAFGLKVLAWSPNLNEDRLTADQKEYITVVTKEQLFSQSDIVSVHIVLSDRTRGLIGEKELSLLKPTSFIVNTSRAAIIDEPSILKVLKEGKIRGGAFDVFYQEPLPQDSEWRKLPEGRVILTPHVGYAEEPTFKAFGEAAVHNITSYLNNRLDDIYRLA